MQALLREVREGPDGIPEIRDAEATADVLSIGSASNQSIQLLGSAVAAKHAVIRRAGNRVRVEGAGGNTVRVNGRESRNAVLATGDVVEIGGHRLTLAETQPGFDLTVEIRRNTAVKDAEFESAFRTDLSRTWLSKRSTAWILSLATLLLGLAIPLASTYMTPALRYKASHWAPTDAAWTSGPLSPAHAHLGQNCNVCHQTLFVPVRDEACLKCHRSVADHISDAHPAGTSFAVQGSCESCHREHAEPMSNLVIREDRLCVSCHGAQGAQFGPLKREPASDFATSRHPAFRASLLVPPPDGAATTDWSVNIQFLDKAVEQSNLKFSHVQHLDVSRVRSNTTGNALGCADCHALSADGEHFVKITMAGNCVSCHELRFDPASASRQLPHGKPRDVALTLQEYFTRKYTDPAAATPVRELRRLPGRETETEVCTEPPLSCAKRRAAAEITNQFTRIGCVSCHVVRDTRSPAIEERYSVTPVRLTYDYFPAARFNHRKHAILKDLTGVLEDLTGDATCLKCHTASRSRQSRDVLMPDIGMCVTCHGGPGSQRPIQSTCISCHLYHPMPVDMRRIQVTQR